MKKLRSVHCLLSTSTHRGDHSDAVLVAHDVELGESVESLVLRILESGCPEDHIQIRATWADVQKEVKP